MVSVTSKVDSIKVWLFGFIIGYLVFDKESKEVIKE